MNEIDPKLKSFVVATLRRASYRWKSRTEALQKARVSRGLYNCASCKKIYPKKEIQLDHIHPVVPLTGWDGFEGFILRLYCTAEGYNVLCKTCHETKTSIESTIRKINRQKLKKPKK